MSAPKLTSRQFWSRIEATTRLAELNASRWEDDTPEKRVRRMAEAVVLPQLFNSHYLPHYFRDEGSPVHGLMYRALMFEQLIAARIPRGHGKSTVITFAYALHQVACAGVLKSWTEKRLETEQPELHKAICDVMREELARLRAEGPVSVGDLGLPDHWDGSVDAELEEWLWLVHQRVAVARELPLRWDPYIQIIAVDKDSAVEFTAAIRADLRGNDRLRSDWGDLTPVKSGHWGRDQPGPASDADFESNGVRVRAYGMQGSIRGGKHGAFRPTLAIFDDADSEETTRTLKQRDSNQKKLTSAVRYGLEPKVGRVFFVGTPHHGDCMVVRLTEREKFKKAWHTLRFRAADEDGTLLYPAKWDSGALAEVEAEDPDAFLSEMGDKPPSQEGNPFGPAHYYDRDDFADVKLPCTLLACDPSYGMSKTSDLQVLLKLRGPVPEGHSVPKGAWLVDFYEQTRIGDPEVYVDHINVVQARERADLNVIEAIALGLLIEAMSTARGDRQNLFPRWVRITHHKEGKDVRIRGIAPLWNRGLLPLPSDNSCRPLENQARSYGESGSKVDGLDTLQMAVVQGRQKVTRLPLGRRIRHHRRERGFGRAGW